MSREIYKIYQFDAVSVHFNRHSNLFIVKALNEVTKKVENDVYDYDSCNTNESDLGLAYQFEHEFKRQQEVEIANLANYELGFSLVVQELIKYKKPLVGHNMFLDLLFFYEQFIDNLPDHLEDFLQQMNRLFPSVYDTKCIATSLSLFNKTDLNSMANQIF